MRQRHSGERDSAIFGQRIWVQQKLRLRIDGSDTRPTSLKALAAELQRRRVAISWWGNIRFEKTFTPDVCRLLAASGCIAVTGGLEVASDRLLKLIDKGVSVAQAARVTKAFADAGVRGREAKERNSHQD